MASIDIDCVTATDGWLCQVSVDSNWNSTRHSVSLRRADFQRLAKSGETPEGLVRRGLEYLLTRESKESILPSFDLMDIERYFPGFEREIRNDGESDADRSTG